MAYVAGHFDGLKGCLCFRSDEPCYVKSSQGPVKFGHAVDVVLSVDVEGLETEVAVLAVVGLFEFNFHFEREVHKKERKDKGQGDSHQSDAPFLVILFFMKRAGLLDKFLLHFLQFFVGSKKDVGHKNARRNKNTKGDNVD